MNDNHALRLKANIDWFNEFFAGIRQIFNIVVENLPSDMLMEDFELTSKNFYFPRQNYAPTMPPYYALMLEGRSVAIQVVAAFDTDLIYEASGFSKEPSIVAIVHSQKNRFGYLNDYALRILRGRSVKLGDTQEGLITGKIDSKTPTEFIALQVAFGEFVVTEDPHAKIRESIVEPLSLGIGLLTESIALMDFVNKT